MLRKVLHQEADLRGSVQVLPPWEGGEGIYYGAPPRPCRHSGSAHWLVPCDLPHMNAMFVYCVVELWRMTAHIWTGVCSTVVSAVLDAQPPDRVVVGSYYMHAALSGASEHADHFTNGALYLFQ